MTAASGPPGGSDPRAAPPEAVYADLRPLVFAIAYRMLGSVADAEDVVQEAFLRYHRERRVDSPKAFLSAVTTRLCIDHLRSARARREKYVGQWLPEPLLTDTRGGAADGDPAGLAEQADSLSMAFLLLLERLAPVERAVFLLHDVFGYGYGEIAGIVDRTEGACRQLASRARRHVAADRPRFEVDSRERDELAARFFAVLGEGDMDGLVDLLAADVVVTGDSGGVPPSWPRPIVGRDAVARLLVSLGEQLHRAGVTITPTEVNGQPGAVFRAPDGRLINVFCLEIGDGRVNGVRSVINPDKLRHLGPLADVQALRRRLRDRGA